MSFGADDASAGVLAGGASGTGAVGCVIEGESNVVLVAVVIVFGGGIVALDANDGEFSMTYQYREFAFPLRRVYELDGSVSSLASESLIVALSCVLQGAWCRN